MSASRCNIQTQLENWLYCVPEDDLADISRLYIVRKEDIGKWVGTYTPVLFKIAVVWDNPYRCNSLRFRLFSLLTEHTLYHEIGHHVFRHGFGIDADQEREADAYASGIMRENHPLIGHMAKFLGKLGTKSGKDYYRWGQ